jgi:hypothetical protein
VGEEAQPMPFAASTFLLQNSQFDFHHHPLIIRVIFIPVSCPDASSIEYQASTYRQYNADVRDLLFITVSFVKNSKEVSLTGNLAEGECDGECGVPDNDEMVIGLCVVVYTREQSSSQLVPQITTIHIVDIIQLQGRKRDEQTSPVSSPVS